MALFLLFTVICWMFVDSESAGSVQRNVSAVEGQNATLPCEAPNNETIFVVNWTRPDLEDQEVLFYRDGRFDPNNHLAYRNRVELKDVKNGDVSLILKNVTLSDSGTYQCYIAQGGENIKRLISSVSLSVDPGDTGGRGGGRGRVGLSVGLTVAALVVVVGVFGVLMFQSHQKKKKSLLPADSDPDLDERFDSKSLNNVL